MLDGFADMKKPGVSIAPGFDFVAVYRRTCVHAQPASITTAPKAMSVTTAA
jgi:hypothetical protein